MRVLAIDIGSSSVKAAFWDGKQFRARTRIPYETHFDGPRAELDPTTVLRAVIKAGKNVRAQKPDAIAFCTLSPGLVITDTTFKPRGNIITHQDRRSTTEARALVQKFTEPWLLQHTANLPYPGGIGSSSLAWLATHNKKILRNARIGQLSSLVGHALTGQWKIDPSQAVFLGLWDIQSWQWNDRLCRTLGISKNALPTCQYADEPLGTLSPTIAHAWNIPAGIPVLGGFVDTSAAVLQTPMKPGQLTHNAGSTDVLCLSVKNPRPAAGLLSRPVGTRGKKGEAEWLAILTIAAAGSSIAWARRELFPDISDPAWKKTLAAACRQATPDTLDDETLPACIPEFSGRRAAIDQGTGGAFFHLHLATTREQLLAALLRGLVRQSASHYQTLSHLHCPTREVFSMGGATDLATRMHAAWKGKHTFKKLEGDSMAGLVQLAARALK
ncbi:MAG TPA: FGGY family carbohydrate kinase [Phycisphaerae bacterium]|nr:FGGY family carbohydrate kinase [Phycisphaerae bacterium]